MTKKRQENPPTEARPANAGSAKKRAAGEMPWHPFWRWLVSLLVVLHLTAVFSAPWNLATGEALPPGYEMPTDASGRPLPLPLESVVWQEPVVTRALHSFFHNYLNLLYLNHGYEFFAPDPAGTHVIDYQVTQADGTVVKGRLPSHEGQWPRLLYHRHMMLAEQTQMPAMGQQSVQQYADHLATLYEGASHLHLRMHLLLPPHQVANKMSLDAPSTFRLIGELEGRSRINVNLESSAATDEAPILIPGAQQ